MCHSFCPQGDLHPGERVCVQEGSGSRGSESGGGLHPGGLPYGGGVLHPEGSASRGSVSEGSASGRGSCIWGMHPAGGLHLGGTVEQTPSPRILRDTVNERTVRILLVCILVLKALTLLQVKCNAVPGYVCMMGPTLAYTEHQTG